MQQVSRKQKLPNNKFCRLNFAALSLGRPQQTPKYDWSTFDIQLQELINFCMSIVSMKDPKNMTDQLLTCRKVVMVVGPSLCLHLAEPGRHLSPIPTIHLSFILLDPPYKTHPLSCLLLLFFSLLNFTLLLPSHVTDYFIPEKESNV